MKILFTKSALGLVIAGAMLSSCHNSGQSQKTGMKYNDKYNGGFQVFRKTHPAPGPGLVPIEGGTFVLGGSAGQDVTYEYNNMRSRKSVHSFYMDETEVSNTDWREYLYWIQTNYIGDREAYYEALPDTLVWRRPLSYNEPYVDNYLRHPAFQDYPVVGVSWVQAREYCEWRTDRMNENILREQGRLAKWKDVAKGSTTTAAGGTDATTAPPAAPVVDLGGGTTANGAAATTPTNAGVTASNKPNFNTDAYLNGQYQGAGGKNMIPDLNPNVSAAGKKAKRRVIREDGILKPGYRLPTEAEWEYAALGLVGNTQFENIEDGKVYPWNGMGVRSPKAKTRGLMLANFKRTSGDNAGVAGYLNDKADITAPVRSYPPNDFGLYNMAGNVNEWTEDTYRQTSFEETDDFNPFRGNQYTNKRYADSEKGIYALDKYGKPIKDPAKSNKKLTWEQLQAAKAQGVAPATTSGAATTTGTPATAGATPANGVPPTVAAPVNPIAGKPFNPDQRGYADTVSNSLYGITTLVNDRSKVYKGGSWNDRAYWLNPATRRFMDQDDASAEVGFRCAMDFNGPAEVNPNGKPEFSVKKAKAFKAK